MAITTITQEGAFTRDIRDAINSNFSQNLSTSGTFTASGAVVAQSTLAVTGATTLSAGLTGTTATFSGIVKTTGVTETLATAISADGAIDSHTSANYVITKSASAAALTLAAPTATTDDGVIITVTGTTAKAHQITATGLFVDGGGHVNTATWGASNAGGTLVLMAYQAKWYVLSAQNVTMG